MKASFKISGLKKEEDQRGVFYADKLIQSAFEYNIPFKRERKVVVLVQGSNTIDILSLSKDSSYLTDDTIQIKNPSGSTRYYSMQPIPDFDYTRNPFVLIKDSKSVLLLNLQSNQIV